MKKGHDNLWANINEFLSNFGSMITSITVIGGAFWWVIKKTYLEPKEKRQHKEHEELIATIEKAMTPVAEIAKKNEEEIIVLKKDTKNHEDRIYVLERDVSGVKTNMKYVEKYVGGK